MSKTLLGVGLSMAFFAIFLLWSVAAVAQITSTGNGLWSEVIPAGQGHIYIDHEVVIDDGFTVDAYGSIVVRNGGTLRATTGGIRFHVEDDTRFQGDEGQGVYEPDIGLWVQGIVDFTGPEVTSWLDLEPLSGFVPFSFGESVSGNASSEGSYGVQRAMAFTDSLARLSAVPVGWEIGDTLLFTTERGDFSTATLTAINGNEINFTLNAPIEGHVLRGENGVRIAPKVGNLSRRFVIESANVTEANPNRRAHVAVMASGTANFNNVEFKNLGPRRKLGRYPVHWHEAGDATGEGITGSSIWQSVTQGSNRWITIHNTQNLTVDNNVLYRSMGNGVFMEAGGEYGNTVTNNLTVDVQHAHNGSYNEELLPLDRNLNIIVTAKAHHFWVRQGNLVNNNVSVGGDHSDVGNNTLPHSNGLGLLPGDQKVGTIIDGYTCLGCGGFAFWSMTDGYLARVENLKAAYSRTGGWYPLRKPAEMDTSTLLLNGWNQAWQGGIFPSSWGSTSLNSHIAGPIGVHNHYAGVGRFENITMNVGLAWNNTYWEAETYANNVTITGPNFLGGRYPRLKKHAPVPQIFTNTTWNGQSVDGIYLREDGPANFFQTNGQFGAGKKLVITEMPMGFYPNPTFSDGVFWSVTPEGKEEGRIAAKGEAVGGINQFNTSISEGRKGYSFAFPPGRYVIRHYATENGAGGPTKTETVTLGVPPDPPSNNPPVANITTTNTLFVDTDSLPSEAISFTGTASDQDGNIDRIEWLLDGELVGEGTLSPVITVSDGDHQITLRVIDILNEFDEDYLFVTVLAPDQEISKSTVLDMVDNALGQMIDPSDILVIEQLRSDIEDL